MTTAKGQVYVKFRIELPQLVEGFTPYVAGSHGILGLWDPKLALQLEQVSPDAWLGETVLPAGCFYQWKVLIRELNSHVTKWEERPNRILKVNYDVANMNVFARWNEEATIGHVYSGCFKHYGMKIKQDIIQLAFTTIYQMHGSSDSIGVVGSIPQLGCWNPMGALLLNKAEVGEVTRWTGCTEIPTATAFEWKLVVIDGHSKHVHRWEDGDDRKYTVKSFSCELFANWNARELEKSLFCECDLNKLKSLQRFVVCPVLNDMQYSQSVPNVRKKSSLKSVHSHDNAHMVARKKSVHFADETLFSSHDEEYNISILDADPDLPRIDKSKYLKVKTYFEKHSPDETVVNDEQNITIEDLMSYDQEPIHDKRRTPVFRIDRTMENSIPGNKVDKAPKAADTVSDGLDIEEKLSQSLHTGENILLFELPGVDSMFDAQVNEFTNDESIATYQKIDVPSHKAGNYTDISAELNGPTKAVIDEMAVVEKVTAIDEVIGKGDVTTTREIGQLDRGLSPFDLTKMFINMAAVTGVAALTGALVYTATRTWH